MNKPDAKFVADILNMVRKERDEPFTPEEIEKNGFAYAFTELTDEEARKVGAKAYLRRAK